MDFSLTEPQIMLQRTVREFVEKELKPVVKEYDAKIDPVECVPRELLRKASKLGFRTYAVPIEYGGGGMGDHVTQTMIQEELSVGDMGFAEALLATARFANWLCRVASPEILDEFIPQMVEDDDYYISVAATEPDHGTDINVPTDIPGVTLDTVAKREGDEYIINGTKMWITNGGIAKLYAIFATTNKQAPISKGVSMFLVPLDTPGFTVARIHDKLGTRLRTNAELVLDNVRVPTRYLLGKENEAFDLMARYPVAVGSAGGLLLGAMRACYEETMEFARTRIQGGRPIIEHPTVAVKLADMRAKIEATRLLQYKTSWNIDNNCEEPGLIYVIAGFQRDAALSIVNHTLDIFASVAIDREAGIEKLIRDICSNWHDYGSSDMNRILSVKMLQEPGKIAAF